MRLARKRCFCAELSARFDAEFSFGGSIRAALDTAIGHNPPLIT